MAVLAHHGGHSANLPRLDGTYTEISPTYISSDLLSPDQKERITIPAIGYQEVQPLLHGTATWGENVTGYGGIGKLPFLGRSRTRELAVTRSHKHHGSGLSKYETTVQPYRHTPLVLSAGRINDQILPPCFKEYLNPKKYNPSARVPKEKYFTHVCRNEVFPVDNQQTTHVKGEKELTERTRTSLNDYYKHLYYRPHYSESFPDQTEIIKKYLREKNINVQREEEQRARKYYTRQAIDVNQNDNKKLSHAEQITKCLAEASGPRTLATYLLKLVDDATLKEIAEALRGLVDQLRELQGVVRQEECFMAEQIANLIDDCIHNEDESKCDRQQSTDRLRAFLKALRRLPSASRRHAPTAEQATKVSDSSSSRPASGRPTSGKSSLKPLLSGLGACWPPSNSHVLDQLKMRLKEVENLTEPKKDINRTVEAKTVRNLHSKVVPRPLKDSQPNPDIEHFFKQWMEELQELPEDQSKPNTCGFPEYQKELNKCIPVKISRSDEEKTCEMENKAQQKTCKNKKVRLKSSVKPNKHKTVSDNVPKPTNDECAALDVAPEPARKTDHILVNEHLKNTPNKLPPLPSFLHPTGDRIQDRLGLNYKTAAHRRYHSLYPDLVPDLRDSEVLIKRYFFYGFHASAFRG